MAEVYDPVTRAFVRPQRPPGHPERPARRQVKQPLDSSLYGEEGGREYNIWYGKFHTNREDRGHRVRVKAPTRCVLAADAGATRGDDLRAGYCCRYFARGACSRGRDCDYLHRRPTAWDASRLALTHDVFGRERHREDKGDMGGVGCMERPGKTLYVNYLGLDLDVDRAKALIRKNFEEWGHVEDVKMVPSKSIAFVRFYWRASAEFAKEAMLNQTLRGAPAEHVLSVKWAYDDPNPQAALRKKREAEMTLVQAAKDVVDRLPPEQRMRHELLEGPAEEEEEDDPDRYDADDPYYDRPVEEEAPAAAVGPSAAGGGAEGPEGPGAAGGDGGGVGAAEGGGGLGLGGYDSDSD